MLDPGQTFLFVEVRDRLPNELVAEARQSLCRWHPREFFAYEAASRERTTELMKKAVAGCADDGRPFSVQAYLDFILEKLAGPASPPRWWGWPRPAACST